MPISGTDRLALSVDSAQQLDDAFDLPSALNQIEQSHRDTLTAMLCAWNVAANLVQLSADSLAHRVPTPVEARIHQSFLNKLIMLGEYFRPRIKDFGPDDLARYGLDRDQLLTTITELEEMTEGRSASAMIAKLTRYLERFKARHSVSPDAGRAIPDAYPLLQTKESIPINGKGFA
jgi:hypothetical protein